MKTPPFSILLVLLAILGLPLSLIAAPANNNFTAPTLVSGLPATATGTNWDATLEANEPLPGSYDDSVGASVWFEWTPSATGKVQIDTIGSNFDTVIAVWTGTGLSGLSEVAANHEYSGNRSAAFINASAGVRYRIAVYGWKGDGGTAARGDITLNIQSDPRSTISGTVTGPDGVTPLEGIEVYVYRPDGSGGWAYVIATSTQSNGSYSLKDLAPGTYRVGFFDNNYELYADEYYNNATNIATGANVVVGVSATVSGINASLGERGRITGKVTGADGVTPLEGIQVRAYYWDADDEYWDTAGSTNTQADGSYSLGGLNTNNYRLRYYDSNGAYVTEYYNNASDVASATNITVGASATVSGINASLVQASRITGTVTGPNGVTPLEDIEVYVYLPNGSGGWNHVTSSYTQADGSYSLGGLTAGTFRVGFFDNDYGIYATEYYNNSTNIASAANIVVGAATTVSGINASLAERGRITGKVTGADGVTPLEGIQVRAYYWDADDEYWDTAGSTNTQADGSYSLGGLNADSYRLRYYDSNGAYVTEYYNNASDVASATNIAVGTSATVSGINASLVQASRITGTVTGPDGVTPLDDIEVYIYRTNGTGGWNYMTSSYTQADGSYSLGGLIAGTFRVGFFDNDYGIYATEYYNNSTNIASAANVVVGAATTVGGINASLAVRGRITGKVTGADGIAPLNGIQVTAYVWNEDDEDWDSVKSTNSQADGSYSLSGLNADNYRLRYYDSNGVYLTEYYNNASDVASATNIVVGPSAIVSGINASLVQASHITGTVTGPGGVTPLEDIEVYVYLPNGSGGWDQVTSTYTQADGSYSLNGLAAGTYRVGFFDSDYELHITEYYNNAIGIASASNIVVGTAATVSGINASLAELGHISGTVTGTDGVTPLEDIRVMAYIWNANDKSWDSVRSTYTKADGSYNLGGLNANSYRLWFYDSNGSYAEEYYNNALNVASATNIVVAASATVGGINASLARGGHIAGTVTAPDGVTPLDEIEVYIYRPDGAGGWEYVRSTYTQSNGSYSLGGLAANTYRVRFFDSDSEFYASECYNNATSIASATNIVVGAAATVSGINASLAERGHIIGKITGPDGVTPLEDIQVRAYYWDVDDERWYSARSTYTQADGSYNLGGLDTNGYRLWFYDSSGTYAEEYYNNVPDIASATTIPVGASSVVSGINASLVQASRITGTVTAPDGVTPLDDINVNVYRPDGSGGWEYVRSAYTQSNGGYSVGGLAAGTYRVGFFDWDNEVFADEYYKNASNVGSATSIVVGASATISGINASMSKTAPPIAAPEVAVEYPTGINLIDSGSAVNLGTVAVGQTGTTMTFTISNLGNQNLTGIAVSSSGSHAGDLVLGTPGATTLAPGAKTSFTVAFKPTAGGARSAALMIVSNDADENPFDIPLVGSGSVPPEIAVSQKTDLVDGKSTVNFGTATVKTSGAAKTFTIKNLGTAPLTGLKISQKGSQASNFVVSKLKTSSLAPGASTTFKVTFKPSATGKRASVIRISSNDANESPFDIPLVGKGKSITKKSVGGASSAASTMKSASGLDARRTLVGVDFIHGRKYRTLTIFKSAPGETVVGTVEVSSNLMDWFSGSAHTTVVADNETYFTVRDNIPISKNIKRFIRLKPEGE